MTSFSDVCIQATDTAPAVQAEAAIRRTSRGCWEESTGRAVSCGD